MAAFLRISALVAAIARRHPIVSATGGTDASLDKAARASLDYAFQIRPRSLAKLAVN